MVGKGLTSDPSVQLPEINHAVLLASAFVPFPGSMVFNEDGRYYENGEWVRMMYGAFSGPS